MTGPIGCSAVAEVVVPIRPGICKALALIISCAALTARLMQATTTSWGTMQHKEKVIDLVRLANGNSHEWTEFVHHYRRTLVKYAARITHDLHAAHDVVQIVFLQLWIRKSRLAGIDSLPAYLVRATKNTAMTYIRDLSKKAEVPLLSNISEMIPASQDFDPQVAAQQGELSRVVQLEVLPHGYQRRVRHVKRRPEAERPVAVLVQYGWGGKDGGQ